MFNDEEEEETYGASRYATMPSLVALQQMRNRLHLAYLGRKLMKWTTLATGRELRRVSAEIVTIYDRFDEDFKNEIMLLARGRYYYPNLNRMVLENCPTQASVNVETRTKIVAAVRCSHYTVVENGIEPYEHLGIDKGGQHIHEVKVAWLELLKKLIMMLELRQIFLLLDVANKNATKRLNAIRKIVVPRIQVTCHYILLELEEKAREEIFRIKLIKKHKERDAKLKENRFASATKPKNKKSYSEENFYKTKSKHEDSVTEGKSKHEPEAKAAAETSRVTEILQPEDISRNLPMGQQSAHNNRIEYLKGLLTQIIKFGREMVNNTVNKIDMDTFLSVCEEAGRKIENFLTEEEPCSSRAGPNLQNRLQHLKVHLKEVVDLTHDYKTSLTDDNIEHFIDTCEEVDEKLDVYMKDVDNTPITGYTKTRLNDLKEHIKGVIEMTENYKSKGLLRPSAEEFIKTCRGVYSKIDGYCIERETDKNLDIERLNHLKEHVVELEKLTTDIKQEGMTSPSLDKFLLSCKDFKLKLDDYKGKSKSSSRTNSGNVSALADQLDKTMSLSVVAKDEGLVSESVDDFIKCCEDMKKQLTSKDEEYEPETLGALKTGIDGVINLIKDLKAEGMIVDDVEDFLKTCETTKAKIYIYDRCPSTESKNSSRIVPCSDRCKCKEFEERDGEVCDMCKKMNEPPSSSRGEVLYEDIEYPCETCSQVTDTELGYFENNTNRIIRIIRTMDKDGTIREETETIIIRKNTRDPTLKIDDTREDSDEQRCALCLNLNQNQLGFRKSKSEGLIKLPSMVVPNFKQCISIDMNMLKDDNLQEINSSQSIPYIV